MWYIVWGAARRAHIKDWELSIVEPWGTAAPGCSALDAALRRSLFAEVASFLGQAHTVVLWDYAKFFDTVDPELLFQEAKELNFPLGDLCLVLQMHLSPRRLQQACAIACPVFPSRSILAGCAYSIPLTRLYLKRRLAHVVSSHPDTALGVYVDDIGQSARGSSLVVRRNIIACAFALVNVARTLRLTMSDKYVVVSSSPYTAKLLQAKLANIRG